MFERSRLNLAYWFTLSMGSILIAFTGAIYYLEAEDRLQAFDDNLYAKVKAADDRTYYRPEQGDWLLAPERGIGSVGKNVPPLQDELVYIHWYGIDRKLIQFVGLAPNRQPVIAVKNRFQTIQIDGTPDSDRALRQLTIAVKHDGRLVGYMQAATPLDPLQADLNRLLFVLTLSVPVTLGIIGLTGWILGGIAMRPIRQSYDRLQRFTADASHELRSPLAAILSNAQVALIPNVAASDRGDCVREIETAAKAMSELIDNLLFLARHDGPIAGADLSERISLQDLLAPLVDYGTAQACQRNRNFVPDIPLHAATVKANPQLLRRALTNLLDNAFKYTAESGTIWLRLRVQAHHVLIQVEDNGIGIPESDLPHIFERFYRVDVARSRRTGGFGLGLSIVRQVVCAHSGQIVATSIAGQGSTFQVRLPLQK